MGEGEVKGKSKNAPQISDLSKCADAGASKKTRSLGAGAGGPKEVAVLDTLPLRHQCRLEG